MLEHEILVIEFGAVDRFAAGSIVPGDVYLGKVDKKMLESEVVQKTLHEI